MSVSLVPGALADPPAEGPIRRVLRWLHEDSCGPYAPCPCDAPGLPFAETAPSPGDPSPQDR